MYVLIAVTTSGIFAYQRIHIIVVVTQKHNINTSCYVMLCNIISLLYSRFWLQSLLYIGYVTGMP